MSKSYDHIARLLQIKTMKEAYLPDLNEIYQRVTAKLQQVSFYFLLGELFAFICPSK